MSDPHHRRPASASRERRLVRAQALSGLVFASFLLLHLLNVMASVFGPGLYDALQVRIRPLYQYPLVELGVLLAALLVHIGAGITRMRSRPRSRGFRRLPRRTQLHRASAYVLLLFIFGHIAATRLPSLLFDVPLGFSGVSLSMVWAPGFYYPYYALLGLCGLYHGAYGSYLALRLLGLRLPTVARLGLRGSLPLAAAAVLIVLGVLSFGGWLYPIADPRDGELARLLAERLGVEP